MCHSFSISEFIYFIRSFCTVLTSFNLKSCFYSLKLVPNRATLYFKALVFGSDFAPTAPGGSARGFSDGGGCTVALYADRTRTFPTLGVFLGERRGFFRRILDRCSAINGNGPAFSKHGAKEKRKEEEYLLRLWRRPLVSVRDMTLV